MAPKTLKDTQQAVLALNSANVPFTFTVDGNQVIGTWKYADVKWAGIFDGGKIDKEYRIVVSLDEAKHSYSYHEVKKEKTQRMSVNPLSGDLSFGQGISIGGGLMKEKEFGTGAALKVSQDGQDSAHTYKYDFNTSSIKNPLFQVLETAGWKTKGGMLSRLFR